MDERYSDTREYKDMQENLQRLEELKHLREEQLLLDQEDLTPVGSILKGLERQSERMTHGVIDTYKGIRNMIKAPFSEGEYPGVSESQYGPERQAIAEYEAGAEQDMIPSRRQNPLSTMVGEAAYFAPLGGATTPAQALGAGVATGVVDYASTPGRDAVGSMLGFKGGEYITKVLNKVFKPEELSPAVRRAMDRGFELSPADRMGSDGLKKMEMSMQSNPFTAGVMAKPTVNNQDLLNLQYLKEIGLDDAKMGDRITSEAVAQAKDRTSSGYNAALDDIDIVADQKFLEDLNTILAKDISVPIQSTDIEPAIVNIMEGFRTGSIPGRKYQEFRSNLNTTARAARNAPNQSQPGYAPALQSMVKALDNLASRNSADLRKLNRQHRMRKLGTKGAAPAANVDTGDISAPKMRNKLNTDSEGYKLGQDKAPIMDTIHAINTFPQTAGNSGTAERLFLSDMSQGNVLKNLLYGTGKHTVGRAYTSPLNPVGRKGVPDLKGLGSNLGLGTDEQEALDWLMGIDY